MILSKTIRGKYKNLYELIAVLELSYRYKDNPVLAQGIYVDVY